MNSSIPVQQAFEWGLYLRALFAFLFVVSLIYFSSFFAKKYGIDRKVNGQFGKESTLSVVETLYLDPRRRLVRVRAGERHHVLLLGPHSDIVIASETMRQSDENH